MTIKLSDTFEIDVDDYPGLDSKKFKAWLSQLSLVLNDEYSISTITELFETLQNLDGNDLIDIFVNDFEIDEAIEELMLSKKYSSRLDSQKWNNIL